MASVAVLTPAGRGAVATLRINGVTDLGVPFPLFAATNGRPLAQQPVNHICFGRWGQDAPEDVVVCRTSEGSAELHCHGGTAAVDRIVSDLEACGCVRVPGAFDGTPEPKGASSEFELIEAECREALSRATTLRTADLLWQQCRGRLAIAISELSSLKPERARQQAVELLRWADFGRHLTTPWRVVLSGRPNVGKSSLINALVGYGRSLVFDEPGTTRDVVAVETALEGWPVELSDTAGLRESTSEIEEAGMQRARQRLESADLVVLVVDTSQPADEDTRRLIEDWPNAIIVAHKSDLPVKWGDLLPTEALTASSLTGDGVNELAKALIHRLIPEIPAPRTLIPVHDRQIRLLTRFAAASELPSHG